MSEVGRVAVVGCGRWGTNLLRDMVALRGVEGIVACDASAEVRARAIKAYPGIDVQDDALSVFGDPSVGAVVIATSVPTHFPLALAALEAGKHTFVEKPLAATSAEAERLRDEAEARGLVLTVDHLLLVDPAVEAIAMIVGHQDGPLGRLLHVYARRTNLGVVRTEENALWSLAPHDIAVMLRLFGDDPERVTATGVAWLQPEARIQDSVFASLEFPGGRLGHLHVSWLSPVKERVVTFVGERAMAIFDDGRPEARLQIARRSARMEGGVPVLVDNGVEAVPLVGEQPLRRMCRAFLDCIELGAPNPSDGALGVRVVRVLERLQAALDAAVPVHP